MGGSEQTPPAMDVRNIREALPAAQRRFRRSSKPASKPMPASLPVCFEEVWRRRQSPLPAHRRERATLEAVASTIPPDAAALTGQPAAAVYLAALVLALHRLLSTKGPFRHAVATDDQPADKTLSRKERRKMRRQERRAEDAVQDMPAADALGANKVEPAGSAAMNVDGDDADPSGEEEKSGDDIDLIANLVYLIGLAVRGSSQAVLNTKCERVLQVVMDAYDHASGSAIIARHTSAVFAGVLAVLDSVSWSKPLIQRAYLYLLRQTCDADSRSRRKARDALEALLKSPRAPIIRAKTSSSAAAHYVSELRLQNCLLDDAMNGDTVLEGSANPVSFVYLLTSAERFAVCLSPTDAAKVSKELVLCATKHLPSVNSFALMALSSLFRHTLEGSEEDASRPEPDVFLPQADLAKLIQALLRHDVQDDCSDVTLVAYNSCIANGAIAYASYFTHSSPPEEYIVQPVKKLCDALNPAGGRTEVTKDICANLQSLLRQRCFKCRPAVMSMLHSFTGNAYRLLWPDTTPVLKRYLEDQLAAGNMHMKDAVTHIAKTVVDIREKAVLSNDRKAQDMASGVLLSLIRGGGADRVLSVCQVRYDKEVHLTNAWLLPILRDGLCGAPLSLFATKLVPTAEQLRGAKKSAEVQKRVVEAKNLGIYFAQVWNLLPGFCNKPSDLGHDGVFTTAFKAIHFCFSIDDQSSMCPVGVSALRQLAASLLNLDMDDPMTKLRQESFGSRFKKLFPTITSVTESMPDERRGQILEVVTKACRAADDSSMVSNLLRKSIRRLLQLQLIRSKEKGGASDAMLDDQEQAVRKQHATADLAIAIAESGVVPSDAEEVAFLGKAMSPFFLDAKESSLQKKAYKATTLLVGLGSLSNVRDDLHSFAKNAAEAGSTIAPGAKAARQGLISALVNQHWRMSGVEEKLELLKLLTDLFLSEVILGTRDTSDKTRTASFGTLVTFARGWNTASAGNDMAGLRQFFMAVAAGLGGRTVSMLSATLTSLGRLIYDFQGEASSNDKFASDVDSLFASKVSGESEDVKMASENEVGERSVQNLVQPGPVAILLRHNSLEVQKSALGVVKIATKVLSIPPSRLTGVLPGILPGLVHAAARSKKHEIRLRVRVILERLLRKCGRDVLEANFPQDHLKLLSAVRKKYSRDLVKKHAAKDRRQDIIAVRLQKQKALQNDLQGEGSDNEFGIHDSDSDIERELLDGDNLLSSQRASRSEKEVGALQMKESNGDVVDLLDAKNSSSVMTQRDVIEASQLARLEQKRKRSSRKEDSIKYTDDGRPIFVESDEGSGEAELGSDSNDEEKSDSDSAEVKQSKRSGTAVGKRQRRDSQFNARHSKKMKGSFGEEYRSKTGLGDVKRAGRPDPYAYIPLGVNMLGANSRSGSASRKNRHGSSLQRITAGRRSKKKDRRIGDSGETINIAGTLCRVNSEVRSTAKWAEIAETYSTAWLLSI